MHAIRLFSILLFNLLVWNAGAVLAETSNDAINGSKFTLDTTLDTKQFLDKGLPQPFRARYKLYYKWMRLGYGEYRFGLADENAPELSPRDMPVQLYRFAFDSHMRFILFSDTRSIYSDFAFHKGLLRPVKYHQERKGTGDDYTERLKVNWPNQYADAHFRKKYYHLELDSTEPAIEGQQAINSYESIYDGLGVQFQFYLNVREDATKERYMFAIAEPWGLIERFFLFDSLAKIELELNGEDQELDCVVYVVERKQKKHRTLMYFAKQLDYLPVQLVHFTNGKKQFSAVINEFESLAKTQEAKQE